MTSSHSTGFPSEHALTRIGEALRAVRPEFGPPFTAARLPGGLSNPTYLFRCPGGAVVIRAKPGRAQSLLPSAHSIEREFRVMSALADQRIPVPRMLLLCEDETVAGRAFYAMEFIEGRIFRDPALPGLSAYERAAIYDEMNRTLAALHSLDIDEIGLGEFGRKGGYVQRQMRRWTQQYRASQTDTLDCMESLISWLHIHMPQDSEHCLVHGDLRLENMIFDPVEPRILAVIDWELATTGHPLSDAAYNCLSWYIPADGHRGIADLPLAALGIPSQQEYLARYLRRTGRSKADGWRFFVAFNFFRLAAISQGVYKRSLEGLSTAGSAATAGTRARLMAELGWTYVINPGSQGLEGF